MQRILKNQTRWEGLYYYRKSVVLYQMTVAFCRRFLPARGDRTVDQMVQAARSGKQNIVEGLADGVASTEMELKLLNVARASLKELKEDYLDYLAAHSLTRWEAGHPRYNALLAFCRAHNDLPDYEPHFAVWSAEETANCAVTLCHMVDKMPTTTLERFTTFCSFPRESQPHGRAGARPSRLRVRWGGTRSCASSVENTPMVDDLMDCTTLFLNPPSPQRSAISPKTAASASAWRPFPVRERCGRRGSRCRRRRAGRRRRTGRRPSSSRRWST